MDGGGHELLGLVNLGLGWCEAGLNLGPLGAANLGLKLVTVGPGGLMVEARPRPRPLPRPRAGGGST